MDESHFTQGWERSERSSTGEKVSFFGSDLWFSKMDLLGLAEREVQSK